MYSLEVSTEKPYKVVIGPALLENCGKIIKDAGLTGKTVVITDSNVAKLYLDTVLTSLKCAGFEAECFVFEAGEENKTLTTLEKILESFASFSLTRNDFAVALGGGVTGDLTGFAAGCYMRGIDYVQLPTTLLAAVDSSVGGKTAVDLASGKNLAGLFIQPRTVICDTDTLLTLSHTLVCEGAAEALKTAIIGDSELFDMFESGTWKNRISEVIFRSIKVKAGIVELDERESGLRKLLNLGHTPAHAIEKLSGYKISHGRAVAIGTAVMARASAKQSILSFEDTKRIESAVNDLGFGTGTDFSPSELAKTALGDKKRSGDYIDLVYPEAIGSCRIVKTKITELENIFKEGMEAI